MKPEPNDSKNGCELPCRLPAVFQKPTRPETEDICAKRQQQQIYFTILRCVPFYFWGPSFFLNKVCVKKLSFWIKAVSFVRGERALISLSFTAGQRSDRPYRASDLPCMSHLSSARSLRESITTALIHSARSVRSRNIDRRNGGVIY